MRRPALAPAAATLALALSLTAPPDAHAKPTPSPSPTPVPSPTASSPTASTPIASTPIASTTTPTPPSASNPSPDTTATDEATPASTAPVRSSSPSASSSPSPSLATSTTPSANPSSRTSAAAAAPAITISSVTCTGGCASGGWVAGFGSYRVAGSTTLPAGSTIVLRLSIRGGVPKQASTATISSTGRFVLTTPVMASGAVVASVASPDGRTGASAAPINVAFPKLTMTASSYNAATLKGTNVAGQLNTRMANRSMSLWVWTWFPSEGRSRWSFSKTVRTNTTGAFATKLDFNNGYVGSQRWKAESTYTNTTKAFGAEFTTNKVAQIDFSTVSVTSSMVSTTYRSGCPVAPSQLTRINMNYFGFDKRLHRGHLIVRSTDVARFKNVFVAAFNARFPMRVMRDPSPYGNDDTSMAADNTYAFFCRQVNGNPYAMSPHSYGRSVDINPVENPYRKPNGYWYPVNGRSYVDRSNRRPGMLFSDSPMTKSFLANGFKWLTGFDWQHFQVK